LTITKETILAMASILSLGTGHVKAFRITVATMIITLARVDKIASFILLKETLGASTKALVFEFDMSAFSAIG
jgi:hypothetical protein